LSHKIENFDFSPHNIFIYSIKKKTYSKLKNIIGWVG